MHNLQQTFFDFVTMTQQLAKVERSQHYQGTERFENDVEHSYQLTMLAWLIIDYLKLPLNKDLVIKLALAHDIIEVYAGDTLPFNNPNAIAEKEKKEADALSRLASEFWETDIWDYIHAYHQRQTQEAKFVYALDKLIPEYNIFLWDQKVYKHFHISQADLVQHMKKAYIYEPLQPFADQLIATVYQHPERFDE